MTEQARPAVCVALELKLAIHHAMRDGGREAALGLIDSASSCSHLLETGSECTFQGKINAAQTQTASGVEVTLYDQANEPLTTPCPDEEKSYGGGQTEGVYAALSEARKPEKNSGAHRIIRAKWLLSWMTLPDVPVSQGLVH